MGLKCFNIWRESRQQIKVYLLINQIKKNETKLHLHCCNTYTNTSFCQLTVFHAFSSWWIIFFRSVVQRVWTYRAGLPLASHIPLTYNFSSMHIDQPSTIPTQIHLPLVYTRQKVLPPHYHQPTSRPNPTGITTKTPLPIPSGCYLSFYLSFIILNLIR